MAVHTWFGLGEGLIEGLIELRMFLALHGHAHHAFQQPRILCQLGIVDFRDFVIAVMHVEQRQYQKTTQQQADDQGQCAAAYRLQERSSTR